VKRIISDKRGVAMLVYYFMLAAVTLMLILLQFNTVLLLNERSKVDNIGDEAATAAAWKIYEASKIELESSGTIDNSQAVYDMVKQEVSDTFAKYGIPINQSSLVVTIDGYYLTIQGETNDERYKSPDFNNPVTTPVKMPFKNTAIIKGVSK
jgi:hypothetical protein